MERRASSEGSGAQVVAEGFGGRKREGISSNRPLNLEIAGVAGVEYRERSENRRCRPIEIRATNRRSEVAFWLRR